VEGRVVSHAALEQHPRYSQQMAAVADVEARAAKIRRQVMERHDEIDKQAAAYDLAVAKAVAEGSTVPPPPPPPPSHLGLDRALNLIGTEQAAASATTERVIQEIAGEVLERLHQAVAGEMRTVRKHAVAVEEARARVVDALGTAARIRRAVEAGQTEVPRPSPADRTLTSASTAELLDMSITGADPLEPTPLGLRERRILGGDIDVAPDPTPDQLNRAHEALLPPEDQDRLARKRAGLGRF